MTVDLTRRLAAEAFGTGMLTVSIIGSGILAERFAEGNIALSLLINAAAAGGTLTVLMQALGRVSGGHCNPAVTLAFALRGDLSPTSALFYAAAQLTAALLGVMIAHLLFDTGPVQAATQIRSGADIWAGEFLATLAFVLVVLACARPGDGRLPAAAGLALAALHLSTAAMSFANPAVTVARTLTDSFTAIRMADAPALIAAQIAAALAAALLAGWLFAAPEETKGGGE